MNQNLKNIIQITIFATIFGGAFILYQNGAIHNLLTKSAEVAQDTQKTIDTDNQNIAPPSTSTAMEVPREESEIQTSEIITSTAQTDTVTHPATTTQPVSKESISYIVDVYEMGCKNETTDKNCLIMKQVISDIQSTCLNRVSSPDTIETCKGNTIYTAYKDNQMVIGLIDQLLKIEKVYKLSLIDLPSGTTIRSFDTGLVNPLFKPFERKVTFVRSNDFISVSEVVSYPEFKDKTSSKYEVTVPLWIADADYTTAK